MPKTRKKNGVRTAGTPSSLMVRLDKTSKSVLAEAAKLRKISIGAYVRLVTVAQAQREVDAAREQVIAMTPAEQLAFWEALNEVPILTESQKHLGELMRGEA